ncbi:hypothetical protein BDN70DRAFT_989725 [Pholiota conissans]|uniref:Uncharacterized protein n=1 Tax=Pholiota conissans TaxID=109636 RepID=A0A9P5ZBA9_9AGAR|nr:hypothetical protein BDN70DRAFT_989725 [Pholiota conissans]
MASTAIHDISDSESLSDITSASSIQFSDGAKSSDSTISREGTLGNGIAGLATEEPLNALQDLESFVPIIERIPGLVFEDNVYHISRPLLKPDLGQLAYYTREIGTLTLTDFSANQYRNVAPETLTRLALLQNPDIPFLPSLEHLRIVLADEALTYLYFCITPSLKSLDISRVLPSRQATISYFLKEIAVHAPKLSSISVGPGRISNSFLQSFLTFIHLRQLSLIDSLESLEFAFLRDVSALPELESLMIDVRTTEYTPRPLHDISTPNTMSFRRLQKLTIVANIAIMADIIRYLFPSEVKEVSLTLVQEERQIALPCHRDENTESKSGCLSDRQKAPVSSTTEDQRVDTSIWTISSASSVRELDAPSSKPTIYQTSRDEKQPFEWEHREMECDDKGEWIWEEGRGWFTVAQQAKQKEEVRQARAAEEAKLREETTTDIISQVSLFALLIEDILCGAANLEILVLDRLETPYLSRILSDSKLNPFEFPLSTFQTLLSYPTLKVLQFARWYLTSVDETFAELIMDPEFMSMSMESLRLPVDDKLNSGITFSKLQDIARFYPRLKYFECFIRRICPESGMPLDPAADSDPTTLEIISIGGGSPSPSEKISIARHISLVFPALKTIITHEGYDAEEWKYVDSLVTMCQAVRTDERRRQKIDRT